MWCQILLLVMLKTVLIFNNILLETDTFLSGFFNEYKVQKNIIYMKRTFF